MYADNLVLCSEMADDLREMVGRFVEVCRRRGLKFNAGKRKGMVMNEEEGLECEVHVDAVRLEHVLEFKYLGWALNEAGRDGLLGIRKMDRVPNTWIREFCGLTNGIDERVDKCVLW